MLVLLHLRSWVLPPVLRCWLRNRFRGPLWPYCSTQHLIETTSMIKRFLLRTNAVVATGPSRSMIGGILSVRRVISDKEYKFEYIFNWIAARVCGY